MKASAATAALGTLLLTAGPAGLDNAVHGERSFEIQ